MKSSSEQAPALSTVIINFLIVYLIWGSTYLAIEVGVRDFPPLFMSASRFFIAGLILFALGKLRKESSLGRNDIRLAVISGSLLCCANALVCVAEKWIPSGMTAMVIGTIPAWITLIHWRFFKGGAPRKMQLLGIIICLSGVAYLTHDDLRLGSGFASYGVLALCCSVILWSTGTLLQRTAGPLKNIFSFCGVQLAGGSFAAAILSLGFEGPRTILNLSLSSASLLAYAYLIVFGSVVTFSSYLWLSRNVQPTKVSTYAVVNPLVAVWLGWAFANEKVTFATLIGSMLILAGITLVIFDRRPQLGATVRRSS